MVITVEQSDIKKIGYTIYGVEENKCTAFICDSRTANIEEILLRNILKTFGDYEIIDTDEDAEFEDIIFITNLPYKQYLGE